MTLGNSASMAGGATAPACFPDRNGQVFLRGQITLYPVPARGGSLLAALPRGDNGDCPCTPEFFDVVATSTALAFSDPSQRNVPEVCTVRLSIDRHILADVNGDLYIDLADAAAIMSSPYFEVNPRSTDPSLCPGPQECGPVDVNQDGRVNQLDVTSVSQSAKYGSHVPCGGVYAKAFSCPSTRGVPLVPAISISLDTIDYFNDEGLLADSMRLEHQFARQGRSSGSAATELMGSLVSEVSHLQQEVGDLRSKLSRSAVEGMVHEAMEMRLRPILSKLQASVSTKLASLATDAAEAPVLASATLAAAALACALLAVATAAAMAIVVLRRKR